MSENNKQRNSQLEVLNRIMPMMRETFEKRKKLEKLKDQIRTDQQQLQLEEEGVQIIKCIQNPKFKRFLNTLANARIHELQERISEKNILKESMENEICIEEMFYVRPGEFLKGIRLTEEEAKKDTVILLYFMWLTKMRPDELFSEYFKSTRNLSRTNSSLETYLISSELSDFPYAKDFRNIFA